MCCLQNEPVTYSPLLTKHRPRCSKIENYTNTHTTHLYFTDNFLCSFYLFSQSQQSLTKCNLFCFESPKLSLSFFNCSCSPMILKWSKRVSLRSVSFTNYPTLHHPLLSTFLFFLFLFFFFTCLQILHITKYYNIPRIQNQMHTKFQLCKYTQKLYTVEYSRNIARCSTISLVINNSLVIKF